MVRQMSFLQKLLVIATLAGSYAHLKASNGTWSLTQIAHDTWPANLPNDLRAEGCDPSGCILYKAVQKDTRFYFMCDATSWAEREKQKIRLKYSYDMWFNAERVTLLWGLTCFCSYFFKHDNSRSYAGPLHPVIGLGAGLFGLWAFFYKTPKKYRTMIDGTNQANKWLSQRNIKDDGDKSLSNMAIEAGLGSKVLDILPKHSFTAAAWYDGNIENDIQKAQNERQELLQEARQLLNTAYQMHAQNERKLLEKINQSIQQIEAQLEKVPEAQRKTLERQLESLQKIKACLEHSLTQGLG
jgi:hypothetical protein